MDEDLSELLDAMRRLPVEEAGAPTPTAAGTADQLPVIEELDFDFENDHDEDQATTSRVTKRGKRKAAPKKATVVLQEDVKKEEPKVPAY